MQNVWKWEWEWKWEMKEEMVQYRLKRTGKPPITLKGERLGGWAMPLGKEGWVEVDLYRTKGGKLVLHVTHLGGEREKGQRYQAVVFSSPKDLVAYAEVHLPGLEEELAEASG